MCPRCGLRPKWKQNGCCKPCKNTRAREAYAAHPERFAAHHRKHNLKFRYGLTLEDYDQMVADQHGTCAICERPDLKLCVDHDHGTGRVRGLLCHDCNLAIGKLEDDAARADRAAEYLRAVA